MATKGKKPEIKKAASDTKVTRITASDASKPAKTKTNPAAKTSSQADEDVVKRGNPILAIGGYFAGAWYELKQVRWPNRRATWGMTMAVLAFTLFFVILILLLDALFKYLFQLILG